MRAQNLGRCKLRQKRKIKADGKLRQLEALEQTLKARNLSKHKTMKAESIKLKVQNLSKVFWKAQKNVSQRNHPQLAEITQQL